MAELINTNVFASDKKFVDFAGLDYFWTKAKEYIDGVDASMSAKVVTLEGVVGDSTKGLVKDVKSIQDELASLSNGDNSISTQIDNAIAALDLPNTYDAKGAADTAEQNAKSYADGLVMADGVAKFDAAGSAAQALTDAKSYADGLVMADGVAKFDAAGSAAQALTDAKSYADGLVMADGVAKFDAAGSAATAEKNAKDHADGLNTAMNTRVEALEADTHTHTNKAELDKIADGDKAKWDAAVGRLETFLDSEEIEGTVDTLHEIQAWMNGDGVNATELTEAIAAEAKLRSEADSAMDTRIKALEDHKEDYKTYTDTAIGEYASEGVEASGLRKEIAERDAAIDTAAQGYANAAQEAAQGYTDALFTSIQFADKSDIDGLFATTEPEA